MPPPCPGMPIQPGLFKGNYGSHGVELIMLNYNEDKSEVRGLKISVS